jgi:hypothetical protein
MIVACNYNPSSDPEPIKKIDITVYWKGYFSPTEKSISVGTLIAKK